MGMYLTRPKEGMGPGSKWYEENVEPFDIYSDNKTLEEHERDFEEYILALMNDEDDEIGKPDEAVYMAMHNPTLE
jgi:hypothetical protein